MIFELLIARHLVAMLLASTPQEAAHHHAKAEGARMVQESLAAMEAEEPPRTHPGPEIFSEDRSGEPMRRVRR